MKRIFIFVRTIIMLLLIFSFNVFGYDEKPHDEILKSIFIGYNLISAKDGVKNLDILYNASYLAIDQFYGNGAGYKKGKEILIKLKKAHIKNLPKSIDDIDFKSGDHRIYTHRGWNYDYTNDKANWKLRKKILVSSVQRVFKIDENKADSLAEFIYYIHILGDHKYDKENGHFYTQNKQIELGGRKDKNDIIDGILKVMPIVFNQENSQEKYKNLNKELLRINSELKPFYEADVLSKQENQYIYQNYVDDVIEALKAYVPAMFKSEPYFIKVFY